MPGLDLDYFLPEFAAAAAKRGFRSEYADPTNPNSVQLWTRPSGKSAAALHVYLSAGIHGDEPAGCEAMLQLLRDHSLPQRFDWTIAPAINASGLRAGTRENQQGIDLNRDFHRRESEEIRCLTRWWEERQRPCDIHLSLHEDWEATGFYFYAINTSKRPCFSASLLESLAQTLELQENGPVDEHPLCQPGLIRHEPRADEPQGWPEAIWLVNRHPTLSYTLEAPGALPYSERVNGLAIALQTAIALSKQLSDAPSPSSTV